MAEIYMGVNELGVTGAGHAFVGVQYDDGLQVEIHGQPEGGFFARWLWCNSWGRCSDVSDVSAYGSK
ncbi:hypothetical protein DL239_21000 [Sedimentitalea sp. CY04]|uniref:Uncharacterized protein n=1 Tax=Parasedimentitalea denitrificans TaxID=2211118 RepID=A0ABX0WCK3_9RHOB|nr:hypothetical protein [Sedimentitalea sp. CY04]